MSLLYLWGWPVLSTFPYRIFATCWKLSTGGWIFQYRLSTFPHLNYNVTSLPVSWHVLSTFPHGIFPRGLKNFNSGMDILAWIFHVSTCYLPKTSIPVGVTCTFNISTLNFSYVLKNSKKRRHPIMDFPHFHMQFIMSLPYIWGWPILSTFPNRIFVMCWKTFNRGKDIQLLIIYISTSKYCVTSIPVRVTCTFYISI